MNKFYTIDFETYSTVDIRKDGIYGYITHPSTSVLMLSFKHVDDEEATLVNFNACNIPICNAKNQAQLKKFLKWVKAGKPLVVANSSFEFGIWNNKLSSVLGVEITAEQLYDILPMGSRLNAGTDLDTQAKTLLGVGKVVEGKQLIKKFCFPQKNKEHAGLDDFKSFMHYNKVDVKVTEDIALLFIKAFGSLAYNKVERSIEIETLKTNFKGIKIDVELCQYIKDINTYLQDINDKELVKLTGGNITSINQNSAIHKFLKEKCEYPYKSLNKKTLLSLGSYDNDVGLKIIELRKNNVNMKLVKASKMLDDEVKGRLHCYLKYHSAVTGRYTSSRSNLLNLCRPSTKRDYTDAMVKKLLAKGSAYIIKALPKKGLQDLATDLIRRVITPETGHKLLIADYSSVERRILCQVAGQKKTIALHKENVDEYCIFASKLYGRDITKEDNVERTVGKVCVLLLGYGGYTGALGEALKAVGIEMSEEELVQAIDLYRQDNQGVVGLWKSIDRKVREHANSGTTLTVHTWSGRKLIYRNIRKRKKISKKGNMYEASYYQIGNTKYDIDSKVVTGHLIQSTARDLLAFHMSELAKKGYEVVLPVHDEVVVNIKNKKQEKEVVGILNTLPKWLDYQHRVEYNVSERYGK